MKHRKVLMFIIIAYGITWAVFFGLENVIQQSDGFSGIFLTFLYRWGPAIAAIIVSRRVFRDPLMHLGLTSRDQIKTPWFFAGLGWVVLTMLLTMLLSYLAGNLGGARMFGSLDMDTNRVIELMTTGEAAQTELPDWITGMDGRVLFLLLMVTQFLLGTTLYVAYTYGEELGWRGFLMQETKVLGFWQGNLVTGFFSGIWYLALFFQESESIGQDWGSMLVRILFYVSLAYPMSYFSRKSGSILTAACMVGVYMALAGLIDIFTLQAEGSFAGMTGLAGIICCWLTTLIIRWKDAYFIEAFSDRPYLIEKSDT